MAKAVFAHYTLKKKLIEKVVEIVREECALMCRRSRSSLFRRLPVDKAEGFSFTDCISELERTCPTLLRLLTSVVTANDARNAKTRVKFRKKSIHHYPGTLYVQLLPSFSKSVTEKCVVYRPILHWYCITPM